MFKYYFIENAGGGTYATQNGTIDLLWDSDKAIKGMLELAWQKRSFAMDPGGGKHDDINVDPETLGGKLCTWPNMPSITGITFTDRTLLWPP